MIPPGSRSTRAFVIVSARAVTSVWVQAGPAPAGVVMTTTGACSRGELCRARSRASSVGSAWAQRGWRKTRSGASPGPRPPPSQSPAGQSGAVGSPAGPAALAAIEAKPPRAASDHPMRTAQSFQRLLGCSSMAASSGVVAVSAGVGRRFGRSGCDRARGGRASARIARGGGGVARPAEIESGPDGAHWPPPSGRFLRCWCAVRAVRGRRSAKGLG